MLISINNPVQATIIFILLFTTALLFFIKRREVDEVFPHSITEELKGFAILTIIFSHIGYFLVDDHQFLFPISIMAGVGVNLFLFLSGFGLTASTLKKPLGILSFYKRRLLKLYVPFWITLTVYFVLSFFVLRIGYDWLYVLRSFLGIFQSAEIYQDLNSPLWYFTLIIFYYLLFPLVFIKKSPWLSALTIFLISIVIVNHNFSWLSGVSKLYEVHLLAFPLGILACHFLQGKKWPYFPQYFRFGLMFATLALAFYFSFHASIGQGLREEVASLIVMLGILIFSSFKKIEFKLLSLFGFYSYEIYLIHWPLLYHYGFIFGFVPGWLAVGLYLVLFLLLSKILKYISSHWIDRCSFL